MLRSLHSSWVKIPYVVVNTKNPNYLLGKILLVHFSKSFNGTSYLGFITPHLLILPINSTTIFFCLWSSIISNSPKNPFFYIILKNFTMTLEDDLIRTYCLPFFSALIKVFKASAKTSILTIFSDSYFYYFVFFFCFILIKNILDFNINFI